ncbi:MAG: methyltransferase domain-containing protein [Ilumatobacteraceae bacterium]
MSLTERVRDGLRAVGSAMPEPLRRALRPAARAVGLAARPGEWWNVDRPPWAPPGRDELADEVHCNICRWHGEEFLGGAHVEAATCPRCGAIGRDRFLLHCFLSRTSSPRGKRVLETSPRLGGEYRAMMRRHFAYRASDFDLSAHRADIQIDLQQIALPDSSVDILLTPHVLEHVPVTGDAIREIARVLAPEGRMYLQVPLCEGVTVPPSKPEFHADDTPVFWHFGWDLTDSLRDAGLRTTVLVTTAFADLLTARVPVPADFGDGFDLASLVEHARPRDLTVVADEELAHRLGFLPGHQFATWECVKDRR